MDNELTAQAVVVPDSPWLGKAVTDHLGRPATVRRVYEVRGQHVAVLTSDLPAAQGGEAICGEHVDLLSTDNQAPAFPGFRDKLDQLANLESALYCTDATEDDARAFRALRMALEPFQFAEYRLRHALLDQARPGDRLYLTGKDWYATLHDLDDHPLRDLPRMALRVRLDDSALREEPHILERHPDGIVELNTLTMWPTLDLI
ncbi:hypothetical protein ACH41H_44820 [Streptomyces sp. NPDC020800]|uniref:hypothetical protein n=1 Tax=Streptomyces sp. NPDC020800 TaxID=3365092 RepID=UPI0037A25906